MWTRQRLLDELSAGRSFEYLFFWGHTAKQEGRVVDEEEWRRARVEIVVAGNVAKFGQNEDLGAHLLSTANRVLVEASPRDRVWGIGMGASNPAATDPAKWRGMNLLGFALMDARERLGRR